MIYRHRIRYDGWVVRRKAPVAAAVRSGRITMQEALRRYQLTEEEFLSWQRAFEGHGLPGLRATRVQQYREPGVGEGRGCADDQRPFMIPATLRSRVEFLRP
jgi:hypothetical protein